MKKICITDEDDTMKLAITNVGPFSGRQEIHLDGITILAGLNGVGKSTFGKVLYCVFSSFYDIEEKVTHDRERTIRNFIFHSVVNMNYQNSYVRKSGKKYDFRQYRR